MYVSREARYLIVNNNFTLHESAARVQFVPMRVNTWDLTSEVKTLFLCESSSWPCREIHFFFFFWWLSTSRHKCLHVSVVSPHTLKSLFEMQRSCLFTLHAFLFCLIGADLCRNNSAVCFEHVFDPIRCVHVNSNDHVFLLQPFKSVNSPFASWILYIFIQCYTHGTSV